MLRISGEHRRRELDDDRHVVEAANVVERLSRWAERAGGRRVRQLRQWTSDRFSIWNDAEELFEIDKERIVSRAGEQLNAARRTKYFVDRTGKRLLAADERVGGTGGLRLERSMQRHALMSGAARERHLEDEVFDCVTGVVDLDLIH